MALKTCVTVPRSVCINSVDDIKKKARENDDSAPPLKFNLISRTRIHPFVRPFASAQSDATGNAIGPFCSVLFCSSDPRFGTRERERARLSRTTTSRLGTRVPFRFPTNVRTLRRRRLVDRDRVDAGAWTGAREVRNAGARGESGSPRSSSSSSSSSGRSFVVRRAVVVRSKGRDALDLVDQRCNTRVLVTAVTVPS